MSAEIGPSIVQGSYCLIARKHTQLLLCDIFHIYYVNNYIVSRVVISVVTNTATRRTIKATNIIMFKKYRNSHISK